MERSDSCHGRIYRGPRVVPKQVAYDADWTSFPQMTQVAQTQTALTSDVCTCLNHLCNEKEIFFEKVLMFILGLSLSSESVS
jgi:hypothetical protein